MNFYFFKLVQPPVCEYVAEYKIYLNTGWEPEKGNVKLWHKNKGYILCR